MIHVVIPSNIRFPYMVGRGEHIMLGLQELGMDAELYTCDDVIHTFRGDTIRYADLGAQYIPDTKGVRISGMLHIATDFVPSYVDVIHVATDVDVQDSRFVATGMPYYGYMTKNPKKKTISYLGESSYFYTHILQSIIKDFPNRSIEHGNKASSAVVVGFGNTGFSYELLELMDCGCNVLAYNNGTYSEIVPMECMFNNVTELSDKITKIVLDKDTSIKNIQPTTNYNTISVLKRMFIL